EAGEDESARDELLAVGVVHLVAMTMALGGLPPVVELARARGLLEHAGVGAEAHRPALLREPPLRRQEIDHRMRGARIDLGRVGALETAHVPRELDHRHLHPEADPQEGDLVLARVPYGGDLSLRPARTEAHRD